MFEIASIDLINRKIQANSDIKLQFTQIAINHTNHFGGSKNKKQTDGQYVLMQKTTTTTTNYVRE